MDRPLVKRNKDYMNVHNWIYREYGKARLCINSKDHKSKGYEWANIDGIYEKDIIHFQQLCLSCHRRLDVRAETRIKLSKASTGNTFATRKPVDQVDFAGVLIASYGSIAEACRSTGILVTSIQNHLAGRSQHAGNYKWRYSNAR